VCSLLTCEGENIGAEQRLGLGGWRAAVSPSVLKFQQPPAVLRSTEPAQRKQKSRPYRIGTAVCPCGLARASSRPLSIGSSAEHFSRKFLARDQPELDREQLDRFFLMVGNIANSAPSWEDYNENSASRLNKREQAPPLVREWVESTQRNGSTRYRMAEGSQTKLPPSRRSVLERTWPY
jgi:hypothetical protein